MAIETTYCNMRKLKKNSNTKRNCLVSDDLFNCII